MLSTYENAPLAESPAMAKRSAEYEGARSRLRQMSNEYNEWTSPLKTFGNSQEEIYRAQWDIAKQIRGLNEAERDEKQPKLRAADETFRRFERFARFATTPEQRANLHAMMKRDYDLRSLQEQQNILDAQKYAEGLDRGISAGNPGSQGRFGGR
jgi:hypothetical protein